MPTPSDAGARRKSLVGGAVLAACVAVTGCYFWAADRQNPDWVSAGPGGYNGAYAEGLLAGHLYMKTPPPPEMAKLQDPYDPAQYGPYAAFDLSYYRGHTYSYFGVAPVLLLYAPWTLLTKTYLSEQFGVAWFMTLGFGLSAALLAAVRRRHLPDSSPWLLALGVIVIAVGNLSLILFWPPYYAQAVQACARFCQVAALGAVFLALQPPRRTALWLAIASVAAGMMVVARPIFLPAIFLLVPPWWLAVRAGRAGGAAGRSRWLGPTLAVAVPIAAVGAGLMGFNYARFDSPFEFGTRYQQFGVDLRHQTLFSPAYFGRNAVEHLFHSPPGQHYFPFLGYDDGAPLGALVLLPFVWLAALLPLGWKHAAERPAFRAFALAAAIAPLGNFAMLGCYYLALARHEADFVMPLCWVAALGLLAAGQAWRNLPWRRRGLFAGAALLAAVNVLATVSFAASYVFPGDYPSGQYPALAAILNQPIYAWEKLRHEYPGNTLRLKMVFPANRANAYEPLLVTGDGAFDLIYVHYLDAERAAIGYNHAELGTVESDSFVLDEKAHTLEITLGSLCPPSVHPVFSGWSPEAVFRARHQLRVVVDGVVRLDRDEVFHPASPGDPRIGEQPAALGPAKFSGRILRVDRERLEPAPPRVPAWPGGGVAFDVRFSNRRLGRSDPLLSAGTAESGDLVFVKYPDADHVQFGFFRLVRGQGTLVFGQSVPAPDDPSTAHPCELRAASGGFVVVFDGKPALTVGYPPLPAAADSIYFGIQGFPAPTEPAFGGQITAIHPLLK